MKTVVAFLVICALCIQAVVPVGRGDDATARCADAKVKHSTADGVLHAGGFRNASDAGRMRCDGFSPTGVFAAQFLGLAHHSGSGISAQAAPVVRWTLQSRKLRLQV